MRQEQGRFTPQENSMAPVAADMQSVDTSLDAAANLLVRIYSRPPYAHKNTHGFLKNRIAAGAFVIPEALRETKEGEILATQNNKLGTYYMSLATLDQVGEIYGKYTERGRITYEAVRQTIEKRMRTIWEESPPEVQEAFPWNKLHLGKPKKLLPARVKVSLARGGRSIQVARTLQEGKNGKALRESMVTYQGLGGARRILRSWGVDITSSYQQLAGEAKESLIRKLQVVVTREEIRQLFSEVKTRSSYSSLTQGENPPLTKLRDLLKSSGFLHPTARATSVFVRALEEELGIVVGNTKHLFKSGSRMGYINRYYFVRTKDITPEVKDALRSNPSLQRFF